MPEGFSFGWGREIRGLKRVWGDFGVKFGSFGGAEGLREDLGSLGGSGGVLRTKIRGVWGKIGEFLVFWGLGGSGIKFWGAGWGSQTLPRPLHDPALGPALMDQEIPGGEGKKKFGDPPRSPNPI